MSRIIKQDFRSDKVIKMKKATNNKCVVVVENNKTLKERYGFTELKVKSTNSGRIEIKSVTAKKLPSKTIAIKLVETKQISGASSKYALLKKKDATNIIKAYN